MEDEMKMNEIWVTKFDQEHAQKFREKVLLASKYDPSRPIVIYINSYGGYVDALAKMIETLEEVPNPIVTACMGTAMSCGAYLLSHGDVRFIGRHSRIMIHETSSGTGGNIQDMKDDVKEAQRLNEHFVGLLAQNCGFKNYEELRSVLKNQDGRDLYLSGQDAIKFGIVDIIGTPKIATMVSHEILQLSPKKRFNERKKQTLISSESKPKSMKKATKKKKSDTKKR